MLREKVKVFIGAQLKSPRPQQALLSFPRSLFLASLSLIRSTAQIMWSSCFAWSYQTCSYSRAFVLPVSLAWLIFSYSHNLLSHLPWVSNATFSLRSSLAFLHLSVPHTPAPPFLSLHYFFTIGLIIFLYSMHGVDLPGLFSACLTELLWAGILSVCSYLHSQCLAPTTQ